jgi:hypothetical protein
MKDYRCWNKHAEEGYNEADMIDSYLESDVPTSIEEDHNDMNKADSG